MQSNKNFSTKYEQQFGDLLRNLRNKKDVSAREMSLELGQNVNYVNLIENGKRFPSMQGFFLICDYMDITPADFFSTALSEEQQADKKLFESFSELTPSQKVILADFLKAFSSYG